MEVDVEAHVRRQPRDAALSSVPVSLQPEGLDGLEDRELALLRRARRLKLTEISLHEAEVAEHERDLGVLKVAADLLAPRCRWLTPL